MSVEQLTTQRVNLQLQIANHWSGKLSLNWKYFFTKNSFLNLLPALLYCSKTGGVGRYNTLMMSS